MGGRAILDGADLYSVRTDNGFPFNYPPFAALTMIPLAAAPIGASRAVLTFASLVSVVVVIWVLARVLRLRPIATATLAAATFAIEPTLRTLLLGQVNLVLLALVVVDLMVLRRGRGVLVGVAAGLKLTPAAFLVVLVLQRDWRSCVRALGAFAATVAIGFVVAPASSQRFWSGGFLSLGEYDGNRLGTDNQTLLAAVLRLSRRADVPLVVEAGLLLAGMAAATVAAARFAPSTTRPSTAVMTAAVTIGGLLGSPVSWSHHWCSITVLIAVLLATGRTVLAGVVTTTFWFPVVWLTYTDVPFGELDFSFARAAISIPYVLVGLACLVWIGSSSQLAGIRTPSVHAPTSPNGLTQFGRRPDPSEGEIRHDS